MRGNRVPMEMIWYLHDSKSFTLKESLLMVLVHPLGEIFFKKRHTYTENLKINIVALYAVMSKEP